MIVNCAWEHNGNDTLLYALDHPGAFTRGASLSEASAKLEREVQAWCLWAGAPVPEHVTPEVVQDASCELAVRDADSDVMLCGEDKPITEREYAYLKGLALKSASDFLALYDSVPDKNAAAGVRRKTFYGQVPRTAEEMYTHTKNVNAYYFGEIGVEADNEGDILQCRISGFEALEAMEGYLENQVVEGSYGEKWSLRKVLRRFIWHDRIHAKAMYRMATTLFGRETVCDPFFNRRYD